MAIGNGMSASFWNDTRIGKRPLHDFLIKPLLSSCEQVMVAQYWKNDD